MIDVNKKLQDVANNIVAKAKEKNLLFLNPEIEEFLNGVIVLSLKQGFIFGVTSCKQTAEVLLKDVKGEE